MSLFRDQDDQATQWRLKLYPKGDTAEASGHLSVYLSNQTGNNTAYTTTSVAEPEPPGAATFRAAPEPEPIFC